PLDTVITVKDIGLIQDNNEATIKDALSAQNANLDITQIEIKDITNGTANVCVISGSQIYDAGGEVPITFKLNSASVDLSTVLTTTNLGEIEENSSEKILNAVKDKNSAVDIT